MAARKFVLVVVDRDTGEFTIEGPMSDDRAWNKAVVNAQANGRNLRCFAMGDLPPDLAAAEWQSLSSGTRRLAAGSIVNPAYIDGITSGGSKETYRPRLVSLVH